MGVDRSHSRGGYRSEERVIRWLSGPGAGGEWKACDADFRVEELPWGCPRGRGLRWYRVERSGLTTPQVARLLARAANVPHSAVRFAGLKDREAVAAQRFTVDGGARLVALPSPLRLLDAGETRQALRPGDLDGNRFTLQLRGTDFACLSERLGRLRRFPNTFGPQRVAHGAPEAGGAFLAGRLQIADPERRKFALIAWQAAAFNQALARCGDRELRGDLYLEGVPSGPLFGARMRWPRGEARALEEQVLAATGVTPEQLGRVDALIPGGRRPRWVEPRVLENAETPGGARLVVELPPGAYATSLLQELL